MERSYGRPSNSLFSCCESEPFLILIVLDFLDVCAARRKLVIIYTFGHISNKEKTKKTNRVVGVV